MDCVRRPPDVPPDPSREAVAVGLWTPGPGHLLSDAGSYVHDVGYLDSSHNTFSHL